MSDETPDGDRWLENFYKECGREVTLAYTTLNQMKNWAMIIAGALLSGVAFGAREGRYPDEIMFAGVVIGYAFTVRFFVRAILCYVNLIRWNTLQAKIIGNKLAAQQTTGAISVQVREDIKVLYEEWRSPIGRWSQLLSNLKLGFALLFSLFGLFLVWGALALRSSHLVQALTFFAVGYTLVESIDFMRSSYFDTKDAADRRAAKRIPFPAPESPAAYFVMWALLVGVTLLIATRSSWFSVWTRIANCFSR